MTNQATDNKPFLRALKCAYKLHKAGLSEANVLAYLEECEGKHELPSASTPANDLLPATFNFGDTLAGPAYWQSVQDRVFNKAST